MKKVLLTTLALISISAFGQEVLSAAGDHISNADYSLSFTLGEMAIETESSDVILTQGFHQTLLTITSIHEVDAIQVAFYPNPTSNLLHLQTNDLGGLTLIQFFDMQGRVVKAINLQGVQTSTLAVDDLPSGSYLMVIASSNAIQTNYSALIQKL